MVLIPAAWLGIAWLKDRAATPSAAH